MSINLKPAKGKLGSLLTQTVLGFFIGLSMPTAFALPPEGAPVAGAALLAPKAIKFYTGTEGVQFGYASALAGDGRTLFISHNSGEVFIFEKTAAGWAHRQTLAKPAKLRCNSQGAFFGHALALSKDGSTALVGASGVLDGPFLDIKYSCLDLPVYVKSGGTWRLATRLRAPQASVGDLFGSALSLSANGKVALVGAELTPCVASAEACGAAYVFERGAAGWTQRRRFVGKRAYPDSTKGFFGSATALSADGVWGLVGARAGDSAWAIGKASGNWRQLQKLSLPPSYKSGGFGSALGLSAQGKRALIGAKYASGADYCKGSFPDECGAAYSFKRTGLTYALESSFSAADAGNFYRFGEALTLSAQGNRAVVGASGADCANGNCGAAYFFVWNGKRWVPQGRYTSPSAGDGGSGSGGDYGEGLTASDDGNSVAISAKDEDCPAGGDDCGAVYLYSPIYPLNRQ